MICDSFLVAPTDCFTPVPAKPTGVVKPKQRGRRMNFRWPISFVGVENGGIIRDIFLDGKVTNLV